MFATTEFTPSFTIAAGFPLSAGEHARLPLALSLPTGCRA
jgi:hypothetical protein